MERLAYFVGRALAALKEAPGMSLVTTLTITAALVVLGVFAVGLIAVDGFTAAWGRVATVTAYIGDGVAASDWPHIRDSVAELDGVATATLVSPEEALAAFKTRGAEASALVEGVSATLLQASIEVEVTDAARELTRVRALAENVRAIAGVVDVDYGREDHARFSALARAIRFGGVAAALLVALATAFIVSNTIRLAVFARRSEIGILKLVGATNGFVRLPFLLEGAIWGACGGTCATALLWLSDRLVAHRIDLTSVFGTHALHLFAPRLAYAIVVTGTLLGVGGAMLAVRRFLDVEPS